MIVYLALFALSLFIFKVVFQHKKTSDAINKIPGPPGLPLLGNLLMFNVPREQLWDVFRTINKNYYPITKFWLGPIPVISIHHPDDLEILLSSTKHLQKGSSYKSFYPWLKTGLVTSNGSKWQHRRKILTPAFHFNILRKYLEITNEHGKHLMETLKNQGGESEQNLIPLFSNHTLHIICESAMGIDLEKIDEKMAMKYKNALNEMAKIVMYRALRPFIKDWMLNSLWSVGRQHQNALQCLHDFTKKVLSERKKYHESTNYKYLKELNNDSTQTEVNTSFGKKKLAFLDLLLSAQQKGLIDDEGIKEELDTFMFAGHDTTGSAIVYVIMLLAEHKEIQERARAEVTRVLDNSNGEIGPSEIQEFHYLERCIKESMRLFPPGTALSRIAKEDIKLRNYVIPAGTEIGCHIFDLHRDPHFWPEPTKYDPDRFLPENIQKRHPYSYIPFSAGPRNCIGQKFALMELKCLTAHILYNFELEPVTRTSDLKLIIDIVLRPSELVFTKFRRLNKAD